MGVESPLLLPGKTDGRKKTYPGKTEHMAALCKRNTTVSTFVPGSLTLSEQFQQNVLLFW